VHMPKMDGFAATAAIRDREHRTGTGHVPIIALTAHAMMDDRERCLDAGMDAYVSKPFTAVELLKTVQMLGIQPHVAAKAEPAAVLGGGVGMPAFNGGSHGNGHGNGGHHGAHSHGGTPHGLFRIRPNIINRDELMARMGGDEALLRRLV